MSVDDGGYRLPAVIDPPRECLRIFIPQDDNHRRAFFGALFELGKWYSWQRDAGHQGRLVAAVWRDIAEQAAADFEDGVGCVDMFDCDDVRDCILTSDAVQSALSSQVVLSGGSFDLPIDPSIPLMDTKFPPADRAVPVAPPPPGCDKDVLWGGIREGIVPRLDDMMRDFLEDVVVQADKAERVAALIGAVPIIGDLASGLIIQFVELAPDILNLYNSHSSEQVLDDIACDLFELVCAECRYPSYDELFSYYASNGITGMDDIANLAFTAITDLLLGTAQLAASVAYHSLIAYGLFILYLGGSVLGRRGAKWIPIWANIGEDLSSDNWQLLCNPCADIWCRQYATGDVPASIPASWTVNVGQVAVDAECGPDVVFANTAIEPAIIDIEHTVGAHLNSIQIDTCGDLPGGTAIEVYADGDLVASKQYAGTTTFEIGQVVTTIRVRAERSFSFGLSAVVLRGPLPEPAAVADGTDCA